MIDVFSMTDDQLEDLLHNSKYFDLVSAYFAKKEFEEWVDYFGGDKIELSLANVDKIFEKCWQLWDTYNDVETLKYLFGREEGSDNLEEEHIDKEALIQKILDKGIFYTLHQYADYACFDFDLHRGGIDIAYRIDDCCYDHIYEDLFDEDAGKDREEALKWISEALQNVE